MESISVFKKINQKPVQLKQCSQWGIRMYNIQYMAMNDLAMVMWRFDNENSLETDVRCSIYPTLYLKMVSVF